MTEDEKRKTWREDLPFPRHRLAYMTIKVVLMALAAWIVLKLAGVL